MASFSNYNEAYKNPSDIDDEKKKYVFDIDSSESFNEIIKLFPIVVVDAWASWCNPCNKILPKYIELAYSFKQNFDEKQIIFLKDNIENDDSIHKKIVNVVPSFFIYVYGKRFDISGFPTLEENIYDALSILT